MVARLLSFLALVTVAHSFAILIDAHAEDCFYETVRAGTKMSLTFQVAEGGFLDIDVTVNFIFHLRHMYIQDRIIGSAISSFRAISQRKLQTLTLICQIVGPDGKPIYSGQRETDGKYTFSAHLEGEYTYV